MSTHGPGSSLEGNPAPIDLSERGAPRDGAPQALDRRLFMQLLVFEATADARVAHVAATLGSKLAARNVSFVLYADANHPNGLGLLTFTEQPTDFVHEVRSAFEDISSSVTLRPALTMIGRTYSTGYEADLEYWLLRRPRETALNPAWPWAVWYPLRRSGAFEKLEPREKGAILREHGEIGKAYGAADLAHDIRLACHGLDANDNEFVIGLIGKELHPLSHVVQAMRRTRQTSEYITQMGPFFVGYAIARSSR